MNNKNLDLKSIASQLHTFNHLLKRYAGVILFILFALSYAFIVLRINMLSNAPATSTASNSSTPSLRIDADAAKQLQTLKDNSSNVQALFEQGRTNPFQE